MIDRWNPECKDHPLYEFVSEALVGYGAILEGWRIRIENIENKGYQYAWINVMIWEPRKKNPTVCWKLHTDTFRENIDFKESIFYYV